ARIGRLPSNHSPRRSSAPRATRPPRTTWAIRWNKPDVWTRRSPTTAARPSCSPRTRPMPGTSGWRCGARGRTLRRRLPSRAQRSFAAALRLDPSTADTRMNLALTLRREGKIDAAVAQWQAVLKAVPDNDEARSLLAAALLERARYPEAADAYGEIARRHPGD